MRTPSLGLIMGCAGLLACSDEARVVTPQVTTESANPDAPGEPAEPATDAPHSEIIDVPDAEFVAGAAPAASEPADAGVAALPRIISLTGPAGVTNGGSVTLRVALEPALSSALFVVNVEGDTGYHMVSGKDENNDGVLEIEVQVRSRVREGSIVFEVAPTDGNGNVGEYRTLELALIPSGVGDVKITLSFEPLHDLDLHVIEPGGSEISFEQPLSPTGGKLDLDSGSNCTAGAADAENVFWPPSAAPPGEYRVTVTEFEECDPGPVPFTVRIENGPLVETYQNTFALGAEGSVIEVATFTH